MAIKILDHDKCKELGINLNAHNSVPPECFIVTYIGAVLDTFERNGRDDSDFCAVVWDEASQAVKAVEYASTRGWTYCNSAGVDATEEVKAKAQSWYKAVNTRREESDIRAKYAKPYVGATVTVIRGRKVPKGFTGKVLSLTKRTEGWNYRYYEYDYALVSNDTGAYEVKCEYLEVKPDPEFVEQAVSAHMAAYQAHDAHNGHSMLYAGLRAEDFRGGF